MAPAGKPLPSESSVEFPSEILTLSPNIPIAYSKILKLETSANEKIVMYARILGYLLLHGPSDEARKTVADEVVFCDNDDQLATSGKYYQDHYIRACEFFSCPVGQHSNSCSTVRKSKGRTPTTSSHPSQPGFDELKSTILLKEPPRSHEAAKQHVSALMLSICKLIMLIPFPFLRPCSGMDISALLQDTMTFLQQNTI